MKTYIVTLMMLLMSIGSFAQNDDDAAFENFLHGWNYLFGISGSPQDFNKAVGYFSTVANSNNSFAKNAKAELGYCYFHGLGVPKNRQKAVEYFQKAASNPDADEFAQLYLSYFYREGLYVKKDMKLSNYWAEQCSEYFTQENYTKYINELLSPDVRFRNVKQKIDNTIQQFKNQGY